MCLYFQGVCAVVNPDVNSRHYALPMIGPLTRALPALFPLIRGIFASSIHRCVIISRIGSVINSSALERKSGNGGRRAALESHKRSIALVYVVVDAPDNCCDIAEIRRQNVFKSEMVWLIHIPYSRSILPGTGIQGITGGRLDMTTLSIHFPKN